MNRPIQVVVGVNLVALMLAAELSAQNQNHTKTNTPHKEATTPHTFGESYATLLPEQKRLIDDFVQRYNQTTGGKLNQEQAYDGARVSVRTTFDAVTHALLSTKLTNEKGQSLGSAIGLAEPLTTWVGD